MLETQVLQSNFSLQKFAKAINYNLKKLPQWSKANKHSLNIKKRELIIFKKKNVRLVYMPAGAILDYHNIYYGLNKLIMQQLNLIKPFKS